MRLVPIVLLALLAVSAAPALAATTVIAVQRLSVDCGYGCSYGNVPAYNPPVARATTGSTIALANSDTGMYGGGRPHSLTADLGAFDTGIVPAGQVVQFAAPAAGEYPFHCVVHPTMRGLLRVS